MILRLDMLDLCPNFGFFDSVDVGMPYSTLQSSQRWCWTSLINSIKEVNYSCRVNPSWRRTNLAGWRSKQDNWFNGQKGGVNQPWSRTEFEDRGSTLLEATYFICNLGLEEVDFSCTCACKFKIFNNIRIDSNYAIHNSVFFLCLNALQTAFVS